MNTLRRTGSLAVVVAAALALSGCGAGADGSTGPEPDQDGLSVLAAFYPLQYVAEQVGGDLVQVTSITPTSAEPHDVELSPRRVRDIAGADVVVYLSGFQPAVDEAIRARAPEHVVDAARTPAVAQHLTGDAEGPDDDAHGTESPAGEDHGQESHEGHDHGATDPHFWLDPTLLGAVGSDVAEALAEADPDNAERYAERARELTASMAELDQELADGLSTCERDVIVVSHAAFGYLTERYGLRQVGISGLDPEAEPSPARLRQIRQVVAENEVTTVFSEVLINPKVAETLAADLGLTTAVLDPVESQADPANDYRDVMRNNLAALREALGCA